MRRSSGKPCCWGWPSTSIGCSRVFTLPIFLGCQQSYEVSKPNGMVYAVTPSRGQTVDLAGGGNSTTVTWTIKTDATNAVGGDILSVVMLDSAFTCRAGTPNCNPQTITLIQPTSSRNLTVRVANPPIGGGFCDALPPVQGCPECYDWFDWPDCRCKYVGCSPILVDTLGNGFDWFRFISALRYVGEVVIGN